MNKVEQLSNFLQRVTTDSNLTTTHISVCTALCAIWINSGFRNPVSVTRRRLMSAARIKSKTTYHKIIEDLSMLRYFKYSPSYNPIKGSEVYIFTEYSPGSSHF